VVQTQKKNLSDLSRCCIFFFQRDFEIKKRPLDKMLSLADVSEGSSVTSMGRKTVGYTASAWRDQH
jgi:hypothetical protein